MGSAGKGWGVGRKQSAKGRALRQQRLAHEIQPVLPEEHRFADEHRRRTEGAAPNSVL